jgi:hypothetical protein
MSTSFYETVFSSTFDDDSPDCEYLGIVLSELRGTYIPQLFCNDETNEQVWKDCHVVQIATPDKDNPDLIHYTYKPLTKWTKRPKQCSPIERLINTWRVYIKRGFWAPLGYHNLEDVEVEVLKDYDPWEICKRGNSWTDNVIDTSLSPFQRLLHNWRAYLHYGTWEEECTVEETIYNESYWDAWDDVMNNWHYFLKDGRKVVLYQQGDLWEVTYDRKDESNLIIAEDD